MFGLSTGVKSGEVRDRQQEYGNVALEARITVCTVCMYCTLHTAGIRVKRIFKVDMLQVFLNREQISKTV
jgi:hypothetical protein